MQIGLQLYGSQLAPTANVAGAAWPGSALDPLRVADSKLAVDFLLLGGTPPGGMSGIGRAADLIVPLAAASLCMSTPGVEIVAKLNCWAFDPAHVARIGGNLARLTRERWSLYLDGEGQHWNAPLDSSGAAARMREFLEVVRQHWAGTADFAGQHLRSKGRIVGPRPTTPPPIVLDSALARDPALSDVPLQAQAVGIDDKAIESFSASAPLLLTCPVVLGRSEQEAAAMARECRLLPAGRCLIGTPQDVAAQIEAAIKGRRVARLALAFPALRIAEFAMVRQILLPLLRALAH
jgi:alkanesulfonate monooxygenase SsuD/methylene tetrahydromethanopterin reductase-like flavin-dependent oxidoreductase (luciferase family)